MCRVVMWTQRGCSVCEMIKASLHDVVVEERDAEALLAGDDKDADAMSQLVLQDMEVPVIKMDGVFLDLKEVTSCELNRLGRIGVSSTG